MWNAPQASAARPSSTRASRQSTSRAVSAPYAAARPGTEAMSGSSYWPMSAVYVYGTAPFSRIHATATEVSRPPEKAMPTRSPTGREVSTLDMTASIRTPMHDHATPPANGPPPVNSAQPPRAVQLAPLGELDQAGFGQFEAVEDRPISSGLRMVWRTGPQPLGGGLDGRVRRQVPGPRRISPGSCP